MSSHFEDLFDSPLGEVEYRIARYHDAVDAAIKAEGDYNADWEHVHEDHRGSARRSAQARSPDRGEAVIDFETYVPRSWLVPA